MASTLTEGRSDAEEEDDGLNPDWVAARRAEEAAQEAALAELEAAWEVAKRALKDHEAE